ncbi:MULTISPECIES: 6-carboxytetrahydropterin synthase [unclassified Marinobacterium]|uniref:6-pyruvoyl trahydropterin synthase family protein n=1 Tax=unclassified Marinobacterium TaxID=2644139 RepID=UPI001569B6A7|nr:6-pyruvoyl tetrahydropterin synthase [Marinobacterium sp. xm-d-543]NRQ23937.1 6-pyruvoyl tetrahydropterin synthase [Marinobacterium sp. xm-m-312]
MKLFVDDLTHVDFTYLDAQRGLVGESWAVRLELDGQLNDEGMIVDFGIVKKRVKQWFDAGLDHSLVIADKTANLKVTTAEQNTTVEWLYPSGEPLRCSAPHQAFEILPVDAIEPEPVARWCEQELAAIFPTVSGIKVTLYPEVIDGAYYHYTHGLQKHEGNCQRIAHGHRSRIHILVDGERDLALEAQWAKRFEDIYIGTEDHVVSRTEQSVDFAYQAPQGTFSLTLPTSVVYMIDTESTVELIANHLAQTIAATLPGKQIEVRAFEGIGKGSIATA